MLMKWVEFVRLGEYDDPTVHINATHIAAVTPRSQGGSTIWMSTPHLGGDGLSYNVAGTPDEILTKITG